MSLCRYVGEKLESVMSLFRYVVRLGKSLKTLCR